MDVYGTAGFAINIELVGDIEKGDLAKIIEAIRGSGGFPVDVEDGSLVYGREPIFFISDSNGGDVEEAINIGRFFRQSLASVQTRISSSCNSACFLMWVGAVERNGLVGSDDMTFGLHRPRYEADYFGNLDADSARSRYAGMEEAIRAYLKEMNVPNEIADLMMRVPSRSMETLTASRMLESVGWRTPFFEEWLAARCEMLTDAEEDEYALLANSMPFSLILTGQLNMDNDRTLKRMNGATFEERFSFPKGHVRYLHNKRVAFSVCAKQAKRDVRRELFPDLMADVVNPDKLWDPKDPTLTTEELLSRQPFNNK
jgi:hypothetical protein